MNRSFQVLLVQNSKENTALLFEQLQLSKSYQVIGKQIETVEHFHEALDEKQYHLIIVDYNYLQIDYKIILQILLERRLEIPLILIATVIEIEAAVAAIKLGVSDVITKDNLVKLKGSIEQELKKVELRRYCNQENSNNALQELNKNEKQLVENEKMSSLGKLLAGIAHEINNPVNFIFNNLNFVDDYIRDTLKLLELYQKHYYNRVAEIEAYEKEIEWEFIREDLPKTLSSMKLGTERIRDLILGLRHFSHNDRNHMQTVDIHEVIDNVLMILQHRLKPHGKKTEIKIIKNFRKILPVKCYPGQLNQVFMNLIANAIDALEEKMNNNIIKTDLSVPYIKVSTKHDPDNSNIIILISDNGPGISIQNQEKIFNDFFTTKAVSKGTGFGLSISHKIVVEKHGGKLECFSQPGKGTEFRIEIPIQGND
ncbi:MAG: ATP-binding protein [Cyanobacteria bacterium P01_D01_bin.50]